MVSKRFFHPVILTLTMIVISFAETQQTPPEMVSGKAQLIVYRYKSMIGAMAPSFVYDVSSKFNTNENEMAAVENMVTDSETNPRTSQISYLDAQQIAKSTREKPYKANDYSVLNLDPGTYYFMVTNFDLLKNSAMTRPIGYKKISFPVTSVTIESDKRYFIKSEFIYAKGSRLSTSTTAEGLDDLKWSNYSSTTTQFSIEQICSEAARNQDSIKQLTNDYNRYEQMMNQGKKQIARGKVAAILGMPLGVTIPVVIGAIITANTVKTETSYHGSYMTIKTTINRVPLSIGCAIGAGLGTTFLVRGINLQKLGKSNVSNGRYNMDEIRQKIEASCKSESPSSDTPPVDSSPLDSPSSDSEPSPSDSSLSE